FAKRLALDRTERRHLCLGRRAGAERHDIRGRRHHIERGALWARGSVAIGFLGRDCHRLIRRTASCILDWRAFRSDQAFRFDRYYTRLSADRIRRRHESDRALAPRPRQMIDAIKVAAHPEPAIATKLTLAIEHRKP